MNSLKNRLIALAVGLSLALSAGILAQNSETTDEDFGPVPGAIAGTTGQLQYNNAGVAGGIAEGTSTQVLTSNGPGVAPSFQAAAGGGAPTNATYITQIANGSLSNEQALASLATGVLHNTTTTGVLTVSQVMDSEASLSVKPAVTVVATTNQALTGTPTIDSVATAAGSIILATAQSAPAENGPWVAAAGAWSRPSWYPAGGTTQAFQFITALARLGTVYGGSTWRITSAGAVTINTTATTWQVTPIAINATTTPSLLTLSPTWTGLHTFSSAEPRLLLSESDQTTDEKLYDFDCATKVCAFRTRTDADGAGVNALAITRGTGTAISDISIGNATNNPTFNFLGTGATNFAGGVNVAGTFTSTSGAILATAGNPRVRWTESDAGTDLKIYQWDADAGHIKLRTMTDAAGTGKDIMDVTRGTTTAISNISFGNATDNNTTNFLGTGAVTASGTFVGTQGVTATGGSLLVSNATPRVRWSETDASTDLKVWQTGVDSSVWTFQTMTDANVAGKSIMAVTRGATTAITDISLGNATDNPTFTLLGTGTTTLSGALITTANSIQTQGASPGNQWVETDQGTDLKRWIADTNGAVWKLRTITDAQAAGKDAITITRGTTTTLASINLGTLGDSTTGLWGPAGAFSFGGPISVGTQTAGIGGVGIYRPATNQLGFSTASTARGLFDANGLFIVNSGIVSAGTKFTASGCSNGTTVGGAVAGKFTSGTTGVCTVTITLPTTTTDWNCMASNATTPANPMIQTDTTAHTTSCTISGTTVTGDIIRFTAIGY